MDLTLHLSAACNLRCDYCHDGAGRRRDYRVMDEATALEAVDFLFAEAARVGEARGIFLYGGEPLLHEPLVRRLVDVVRARDQAPGSPSRSRAGGHTGLHLTTNGTRLSDDFLALARRAGINVALSLDGNQPAHDAHRRLPDGSGTWAAVDEALGRLLRVLPYAPVRTTITPESVEHLPDSFDYLVDRGVRCLVWATDFTSPWTPEAMDRLGAAFRAIARRYQRRSLRGERFYFSPFDGKVSAHVRRGEQPRFRCKLGYQQISVAPGGELLPCVEWVGDPPDPEWVIGHVKTGFDERRRLRLYRQSQGPKPECEGCALEGRCQHWCACLNYRTTGCTSQVSPVVCAHERMLMPIADEVGSALWKKRDSTFIHKHYNELYPFLSLLEDLTGRRRH